MPDLGHGAALKGVEDGCWEGSWLDQEGIPAVEGGAADGVPGF